MSFRWPMPLPRWIDFGMRYRGTKEIPGKNHSPVIQRWLKSLKAWWTDDETPWCGVFVGEMLRQAGFPIPAAWYRAKAYETYGTACSRDSIPFGAICTKTRTGGGHVFFAVAESRDGQTIFGLGGNQSNEVNITSFKRTDITAVRWPQGAATVSRLALPIAERSQLGALNSGGSEA